MLPLRTLQWIFPYLFVIPAIASADTHDEANFNACLLQQMQQASDDVTLGELKIRCKATTTSPVTRATKDTVAKVTSAEVAEPEAKPSIRKPPPGILLAQDEEAFTLLAHKPNYAMPFSYNSHINSKPFPVNDDKIDHIEFKFQLSLRTKVWENVFDDKSNLYIAYTNSSWWQSYNDKMSSPFRDTNHEPELFLTYDTVYDLFGLKLKQTHFGMVHQSNGRSLPLSRSWNRLYLNFLFQKDNFYMSLKPWWRIPESKKDSPLDTKGDDNPDIVKYMGYGELNMGYWLGEHSLGMMFRNNLRSDNKGAIQLDWTFPLKGNVRGYIQYFNGYGESLIDYNASVNRYSIGFMITP